jgi:mannosyltransferase
MSQRWTRAEVVGVGVLAAVIGVVLVLQAATPSIWWDEVFSWRLAQRSFEDQVRTIPEGAMNGIVHHLVAAGLAPVTGDDLTWLRVPSILAWLAGIPLFHSLARRIRPDLAALGATVVFALAPYGLRHALEFRMYAFASTATIVATLLLVRFVERPDTRRAVLYGMAASAALYTHYFVALVVAGHAVALILHPDRRRLIRVGWPATVPVALALMPLIYVMGYRGGGGISWIPAVSWAGLTDTVLRLLGVMWEGYDGWRLLPALPLVILLGAGLVAAVVSGRHQRPDERWLAQLVAMLAVGPVVATLAISVVVQPVLLDGYLVIVVAPVVLTALVGADALTRWLPRGGATLATAVAALAVLAAVPSALAVVSADTLGTDDFRWANRVVVDGWRQDDLVVTTDHLRGEQARDAFGFHLDVTAVAQRTVAVVELRGGTDDRDSIEPIGRVWVLNRGQEYTIEEQVTTVRGVLGDTWSVEETWTDRELGLALLVRARADATG